MQLFDCIGIDSIMTPIALLREMSKSSKQVNNVYQSLLDIKHKVMSDLKSIDINTKEGMESSLEIMFAKLDHVQFHTASKLNKTVYSPKKKFKKYYQLMTTNKGHSLDLSS